MIPAPWRFPGHGKYRIRRMDTGWPPGWVFLSWIRYTIVEKDVNVRGGDTVSSIGNGKTPEGRGFL
jgi:hypothetical protein